MRKVPEFFQINQRLDRIPRGVGKPVKSIFNSWAHRAFNKEVHFSWLISNIDDLLLHESKDNECQENEFVLLEETTRDPLIDGRTDIKNQGLNTSFIADLCSIDGFEEESDERLQGVLIHVIHDTQRNYQEVKHGAFSCYDSVMLSLHVDFSFSDFSFLLLFSNFNSRLLCFIEILNKFCVIQNSRWISFRKRLQQIRLQLIESHSIFVLLLHQILFGHF